MTKQSKKGRKKKSPKLLRGPRAVQRIRANSFRTLPAPLLPGLPDLLKMARELGPDRSIVDPLLFGEADVFRPVSHVIIIETAQGVQLAVRSGLAGVTEALVVKSGREHVALGAEGGQGVFLEVLAGDLKAVGWEVGRGEEGGKGVGGGGVGFFVRLFVWWCVLLNKTGSRRISEWKRGGAVDEDLLGKFNLLSSGIGVEIGWFLFESGNEIQWDLVEHWCGA